MARLSRSRPADDLKTMGDKLWKIWLVVGGVAILLYYTILPRISHGIEVDYFLIASGAAAVIFVGARLHRPRRPWTWYLLAAGMASWAIGDGIWNAIVVFAHSVPYPSIADPFYLLAYPLFGAGLFLARRKRSGGSRIGSTIEAAIITLGASLVSWILLMRPYLTDPSAGLMAKGVSVSYPIADLILLGVIIPMLGETSRGRLSSRFLMTWLTMLLATDAIYSIMIIHGSYVVGSWVDAGWLIGYVALGAAALHPSMAARQDEPEAGPKPRSIGRARLALLAVASLAGPAVIVMEAMKGDWSDVLVTAAGCLVLAMLILVRLTGLVREADTRRLELDRALEQIGFQALHDPLTGLANRTLFSDRTEHASARARRHQSTLSVMLLDLDGFKAVNDSMGHAAGDELLKEVARRLQGTTRASDTVARLGGDEFAILVEDLDHGGRALRIAERIINTLKAPIFVGGRAVFPSASVGIAVHDPASDASETIRHADVAMYSAKRMGKGRFVLFVPEMTDAAELRVGLEAEMRRALGSDLHQFVVHYQPIVALASGAVQGVEALVRWNHPSRGFMPPNDFLPIAEETGLIVPLGRWVLGEACRQVEAWRRSIPGMEGLAVSVNLSTKQVEDADLQEDVQTALTAAGLDPSALTLELTEDLLVRDVDAVDQVLQALASLGVRLSVDDFGSGNSSFSYLRRFPITELKIDKSYVDGLAEAATDPSPVQGLIDLGRSLRFRVVAEGIEQPGQASALREMGCQSGQGFLFSPPQAAELTETALRERGAAERTESPAGSGRALASLGSPR